ncbi:pPIWI-associating nuclease domain-containing protein [Parvibaculum sp. MBR-TMA-1.3b-4.2]|jgi:hypothetical protein
MTDTSQLLQQIDDLKENVSDNFSRQVLDGAKIALLSVENPLRLNFFATAVRILLEHSLSKLAPTEEVVRCVWYKDERPNPDGTSQPTRRQKAIFAIQGGLSDVFLEEELGLDTAKLHQELLRALNELSKHVHARENTAVIDTNEQDQIAATLLNKIAAFFGAIHDCRKAVLDPILAALDEAAVDALLSETILEIDELSSHHSIEDVYAEKTEIYSITSDEIIYNVFGSVETTLQWGSNSDIRRGDGAEIDQTFPFTCSIAVPLEDPWDLGFAEIVVGVDTSSWTNAMRPDEYDYL